jgi:hypothetical protein
MFASFWWKARGAITVLPQDGSINGSHPTLIAIIEMVGFLKLFILSIYFLELAAI